MKNISEKTEPMVIDVSGTCSNFKDIYGHVWVDFYNTNTQWQEYFIGKESYKKNNAENIHKMLKDVILPQEDLYSIFFAANNDVFHTLGNAYFIYFKEYEYFIAEIYDLIKKRLDTMNLIYEHVLIDDKERTKLDGIKKDLSLYNDTQMVKIIKEESVDFSNNFKKYSAAEYKNNVAYATENSVAIRDVDMDPDRIRRVMTDFIGNFLVRLEKALPKYDTISKTINKAFSEDSITRQKGTFQSKII